jgi:hypothetical protein
MEYLEAVQGYDTIYLYYVPSREASRWHDWRWFIGDGTEVRSEVPSGEYGVSHGQRYVLLLIPGVFWIQDKLIGAMIDERTKTVLYFTCDTQDIHEHLKRNGGSINGVHAAEWVHPSE